MLAVRAGVPQSRVGQRHERVVQDESKALECLGEVAVPGRPPERQVELSVVLHELGVVLRGRSGPAGGLHRCQVALAPCSRGSGGGRRLELGPEDQGLENRLPLLTNPVEDADRRFVALAGADHERTAAPAAPALEEPLALEELDRLLNSGPADSEETCQLSLRRERLPR